MSKRMWTVAVLALALPAFAQEMSGARGEARALVGGKAVSIEYGRPSLKGRDMLAQAQVGQAWRMGSGDATTLKTDAELTFGTVHLQRGEYILTATRLDTQHWQLNVLAKADRSKVADVPLTSEPLPQSVEQFTIELTGDGSKGELKLSWGTAALRSAFTAK